MLNGILVIDKPQGMTSHDVVSFLRRKTGVKRIGHTGTLDPMATGVLPVYIGNATRMIEYAGRQGDPEAKVYRCTMRLGLETDTQDIWGATLAESGERPVFADAERVLKGFEGHSTQRPPMYSAVKVGGRKLYEYARKGEEPDAALVKQRDIFIKHICVIENNINADEICFDIVCTKGVYVRTLCADAGRLLGCGAVMSGLIRLKSDGFSIDDAVSLDDLRGDEAKLSALLPMDAPMAWMARVDLDRGSARRFISGQSLLVSGCQNSGDIVRVYGSEGFLGVGELIKNAENPNQILLKPRKVIII